MQGRRRLRARGERVSAGGERGAARGTYLNRVVISFYIRHVHCHMPRLIPNLISMLRNRKDQKGYSAPLRACLWWMGHVMFPLLCLAWTEDVTSTARAGLGGQRGESWGYRKPGYYLFSYIRQHVSYRHVAQ